MHKTLFAALAASLLLLPALAFAGPTFYPRGVTIYNPEKSWSGYTVLARLQDTWQDVQTANIIDMSGKSVHEWPKLYGFPNKVFPNGQIMGHLSRRTDGVQDMHELVLMDFDGKVVWEYNTFEKLGDLDSARWHHDYQVSGSPVGYYAPGQNPNPLGGNMLILGHTDVKRPDICANTLLDDIIYELDPKTKQVVWSWKASDSFDQLGFDDEAKMSIQAMRANKAGVVDWVHINSASYVGPNKWWDEDPVKYAAFNPENIIWDARGANIIGITDRSGNVVWRIGPDYSATPELRKMGWIIGQHHAHIIPKGLPGAGNVLVYDNGGSAGYAKPTAQFPGGFNMNRRDSSRVLEIDPITFEVVWEYSNRTAADKMDTFYSHYISAAQRLPNGNTLITEGATGRVFEVTPEYELVWEYLEPEHGFSSSGYFNSRAIYRAYRVPYEWVPQLAKPVEKAIVPAETLTRPLKTTTYNAK